MEYKKLISFLKQLMLLAAVVLYTAFLTVYPCTGISFAIGVYFTLSFLQLLDKEFGTSFIKLLKGLTE